ncbi:glycosyltransferase [Lithospermum erythrorhizon]|uniref:Glycosyltransferase n=1 Tax=Lithospermum erythrorhizon TaxID=34254 RepID=A0AAV3RA42_LITER
MRKPELVFIPGPGIGHIASVAEFATRLLDRDARLSITVVVITTPITPDVDAYIQSLVASDSRIRYIILPLVEPPSLELLTCPENYVTVLIENHKHCVKNAIQKHVLSESRPLAGLVIDFFCTSMIDVANELNAPSYLYFPSTAAFLGLMLYIPTHNEKSGEIFEISDSDHDIPTYPNPVPARVLPNVTFQEEGYACFLKHSSRFQETNGYIINSFSELEPYAITTLAADKKNPPVYTVGPLLDLKNGGKGSAFKRESIMNWLDAQPDSSVVYLSFGSMGAFDPPQLMEIAIALEKSGLRFLWCMRQARSSEKFSIIDRVSSLDGFLPKGFLERTKTRGMICGWAPQVDVLAHEAVGGFVSHCGWNSILESLWNGVPIATWSIYAEQQLNSFEMVKVLGLAVELKIDYRCGTGLVTANEIEKGVTSLMDQENVVRKKVKQMKEKCRQAVVEGGSSFDSLGCFIQKIVGK